MTKKILISLTAAASLTMAAYAEQPVIDYSTGQVIGIVPDEHHSDDPYGDRRYQEQQRLQQEREYQQQALKNQQAIARELEQQRLQQQQQYDDRVDRQAQRRGRQNDTHQRAKQQKQEPVRVHGGNAKEDLRRLNQMSHDEQQFDLLWDSLTPERQRFLLNAQLKWVTWYSSLRDAEQRIDAIERRIHEIQAWSDYKIEKK